MKLIKAVTTIFLVTLASGVTVANLHLTGGRYDDPGFLRLVKTRSQQIGEVVSREPDIIVGDFNSEYNVNDALTQLSKYPFYRNLPLNQQPLFRKYYMDWVDTVLQAGYSVAPTGSLGQTSVFGGKPDMVFYKNLRVADVALIDYLSVAEPLTDHNAIIVDFKN